MNRKIVVTVFGVLLLAAVGVTATAYTPSTIETARIRGDEAKAVELKGEELGLICITYSEGCSELIARAEKNPQLKAALLKARSAGIWILPKTTYWFSVGSVGQGYVVIHIPYSDEKIISFLTK